MLGQAREFQKASTVCYGCMAAARIRAHDAEKRVLQALGCNNLLASLQVKDFAYSRNFFVYGLPHSFHEDLFMPAGPRVEQTYLN